MKKLVLIGLVAVAVAGCSSPKDIASRECEKAADLALSIPDSRSFTTFSKEDTDGWFVKGQVTTHGGDVVAAHWECAAQLDGSDAKITWWSPAS